MRALKIIFMLFIISVLVSQSAMDLFSTLLCAWWAYLVWRFRKSEVPLKLMRSVGLELVWVTWFFVVVIGFLLNWNNTSYALERIIEFKWVLILYVMFEVMIMVKPNREALKFIIPYGLIVAVGNLILYFSKLPVLALWQYKDDTMPRAGGFFANPMTFAHSFVIPACFFIGLVLVDFKNWKKSEKLLMGGLTILSILGLYLTFTRGVWIGFTAGVIAGIIFWRPKYIVIAALLGIFGFFGLYSVSPYFRARIDRTTAELHGDSERKVLWKAHFLIFQENPVFGAGYGQNTKQLPQVYERIQAPPGTLVGHAHNQYLHLAAGTGILGLLCYLTIWFFFLKKTYDLWKYWARDSWDQGVALGLMIGQTAFLVGSFTEANFEHSKVRFMVMLAWAYVIYLTEKYRARAVNS